MASDELASADVTSAAAGRGQVEVIRSEQHLETATVVQEFGRVRLRKVVFVEERVVTVQVRREAWVLDDVVGDEGARVVDPALPSSASVMREGQIVAELVLHEEQVEVVTKVVPVELVRLRVVSDAGEDALTMPVSSEHIEVTEDPR